MNHWNLELWNWTDTVRESCDGLFFRLSFCLCKRNWKVGVRELQGGWLAGLGREFTWKLGKDTIKTQDGAALAPVSRKYWWCSTISVPLCVNKSETASWTLGYKLKTKFLWKSYSGRQKCHTKVLRHDFWRSCFVFGSCVLRSKCSSPIFMRVKSLKGFKTEKDSPKKLLYAPLILHGEAPSMAQDYLLLLVFHLSPNICRNFVFDIKP